MRIATALMLAALLAAPTFAQQPAATSAPPSLVRTGVTQKLTDHVWAIPDGSASLVPNVGIVVGRKAVLVIETGMGARNAQTILAEVARVATRKPIYLVTTHVHPEHDLGAHAFPKEAKMIRSQEQLAAIAAGAGLALVPLFTQRSELNRELLKDAKHRDADITFAQEYTLDLGGVSAQIHSMGTNHTQGDTAVLVDGVLFAGDVAMTLQPMFTNPSARISHWLASLDRYEAMHPEVIVPSHGPFGTVAMLEDYRRYLTRVRDRTAALKKAGKTAGETLEIVTAEMVGEFPDRFRLTSAINAGYAEAP
jgi:glyoxylase-like metal-dependent hydrolase (beta-lactamase superfamily II)